MRTATVCLALAAWAGAPPVMAHADEGGLAACVRFVRCGSDACRDSSGCDAGSLRPEDREYLERNAGALAAPGVSPEAVAASMARGIDPLRTRAGTMRERSSRRGFTWGPRTRVTVGPAQTALPTGQPMTALPPGEPMTALPPDR